MLHFCHVSQNVRLLVDFLYLHRYVALELSLREVKHLKARWL